MRRRWEFIFVAALALAALSSIYCLERRPDENAPDTRGKAARTAADTAKADAAPPEFIDRPGLENTYKVTETLYRGAQPTAEGLRELEKLGIRTVVNLRLFHDDEDELEGTKLDSVHIRVEAWDADEDEVVEFLKVATDPARQPVFVHRKHGSDRTGMMVAVYRVAVQGWSREDAAREMAEGPFGYHRVWREIKEYVEELDVEHIRREAGLDEHGRRIVEEPGAPTGESD